MKKLKLAVIALCIAPMAFAQTDDTAQQKENDAIVSEQSFTFTEAQLGENDDMSQNVSIISSNQNIYASQVGFVFAPHVSATVLLAKSTMRFTSTVYP